MRQVVVGIDGGGTSTRALVADLDGHALASARAGGSNPQHNWDGERNARQAIEQVLAAAGCVPEQVVGLVAGFAGLDGPDDAVWAERFTALPGLTCPRLQVNDAVIAHAGALRRCPGIIAISGTGSAVFGVTPNGRQLRNYDFCHYAPSSARHLAFDAAFRILGGEQVEADEPFVRQVLAFWGVPDLPALVDLGAGGFMADADARTRRFGEMGSLVTRAAEQGLPLPAAVCDHAAALLARGIRLVGACFPEERVEVAFIGSAVRSPYMSRAVAGRLSMLSAGREFRVVEPALSPVQGAVLMALEQAGRTLDEALVRTHAESTGEPGRIE